MTRSDQKSSLLARLDEAAQTPGLPQHMLNAIASLRRNIAACDPDVHAGMLGRNGYAPAVDDYAWQAGNYARHCARADQEKRLQQRAEPHRRAA